MQRVVLDEVPTDKLYLSELVESLKSGKKIVVFYRANNKPDGVPAFLKTDNGKYYFESMMPSYNATYLNERNQSLYDFLRDVSKARTLFVCSADEINGIFNLLD